MTTATGRGGHPRGRGRQSPHRHLGTHYRRGPLGERPAAPTSRAGRRDPAFFQHEWVVVGEFDRVVAEIARKTSRSRHARPRDAVHVGTGVDAGVERFDTYDDDLMALSGTIDNPALLIANPNLPEPLF